MEMKSIRFILFGSLVVAAAAYVFGIRNQQPIAGSGNDEPVPALETQYPLIESAQQTVLAEPIVMPEAIPVVATETSEVKTPVQPLEERSDAMLFEIDALQGMPFDQAITMPFD